MENKNTTLINKDRVWNRIKNYIYIVVFLIVLLIILLASSLVLNCCIYHHLKIVPTYTST